MEKGLVNYWGYNSIGYFAPDQRYAARHHPSSQVQEFRRMVQALHEAGIEVILDVVYNHTGEGSHLGPTLCFKGFDNRFYRWLPDDPGVYLDFTGCGNSLNMDHPFVLQMVMDSLRYWVTEMHVDGFRFDLAVTLARENYTPRPAVGLLRPHPAGPGARPGEADRRTVGRGRRRLHGGELPARLGRVERQVPGLRARLLARRQRRAARVRHPHRGLERPLHPGGPHALRQHQLHHRARRLHAAGPGVVRRQAQRGQQGGQPRRRPTTTRRGTAAPRARPTTPS